MKKAEIPMKFEKQAKEGDRHWTVGLALLLCLMMLLCTACGTPQENTRDHDAEKDDTITIGMCFDSFIIERWEKDRDVFVATARDLGAEVNVQNANGEIREQIEQIEYFIRKKVDAIVIVSIDGDALEEVVTKAKNNGIKVIAYDRMISNANIDLYISFDNVKVGMLMAEALADSPECQKGVIMLQGSATDHNVADLAAGFQAVMEQKNIQILDSMYAEGWNADAAAEYLYANPHLLEDTGGIMCGNDNIATSVVRVLSEQRKAGVIPVVGQDAELEACQRIVEGTQSATVYKPVEREAEAAATATVALIRGEKVENTVKVNDGVYEVPGIILEPVAVKADNMDEVIIGSGFHLKEEVYMNVAP